MFKLRSFISDHIDIGYRYRRDICWEKDRGGYLREVEFFYRGQYNVDVVAPSFSEL
jgi:hypothetical protein